MSEIISKHEAQPGRAWWVYILLCEDNAYYVGLTHDLDRRWQEHLTGRGGHYTRTNRPVRMAFAEPHPTRAAAERRERQLKGWTRRKKEALIAGDMQALKRS